MEIIQKYTFVRPAHYISILFFLLILSRSENSHAQFLNPVFVNRGDTVVEKEISDNHTRWIINNSIQIHKFESKTEIWRPLEKYSYWSLGATSQVWTLPKAFRLWYSEEGLAVWQYQPELKDWLRQGFAPKYYLADSLSMWRINDTISFTLAPEGKKLWKVDPDVVFWKKEIIGNYDTWQLNDTVSFWKVDSLQHIQEYQDSTELWELDRQPKKIQISKNTIIWTLLPHIEAWKAGDKINIWSFDSLKNSWQVNDTLKYHRKGNKQRLWEIDKNIKVLALANDSVQIWRRNAEEKIWSLSRKFRAWHYKPPPPIEVLKDTIEENTEPEVTEKIKLLQLSKRRKGWVIDDSTYIWQFEQHNELWKQIPNLQMWHVDDSTDVWSLLEQYQITRINKQFRFWKIDNKAKEWKEIRRPRNWQINDTAHVWWLSPEISVTSFHNNVRAWNVETNLNISQRPERNWILNDTSEYWQISDTTLFWTPHKEKDGEVWKSVQYTKLPVSDSIFFWRVNEQKRISRIKDSLTVWELKHGWIAIDSVFNFKLNDTTRIWMPTPEQQIWQSPNSTRFWKRNKKSKVYRLRDSIRAWTFYRPPNATGQKKKSNWKINGHFKANSYQNQLRNWARGGESNVSFQAETRLDLQYEHDYLKSHTWTELKFGVNIPGEKPLRKTEDKIELDTKLNWKSKTRWSFTLHSKLKTQFTEGRDYNKDKKVSDFLAPLYFNLGLGFEYQIKNMLSLYFSPLTAKMTHVNDTVTVDQTKFGIAPDKTTLNQTGAYINSTFKMNISKNIRFESRFTLFSNYFETPENIDIDWFFKLLLNVNRFISSEISVHMIYDDDILIPIYRDVNGEKTKVAEGPRLQMQELFKVGFQFKF